MAIVLVHSRSPTPVHQRERPRECGVPGDVDAVRRRVLDHCARRWRLLLRRCRVLRIGGGHRPQPADRRHRGDAHGSGLLVGRVRRWIFSYGDAAFHGSMGHVPLNEPIVGIAEGRRVRAPRLRRRRLHLRGGGVPRIQGRQAGRGAMHGIAASADGNGYWLAAADGQVVPFGVTDHGNAASDTGATEAVTVACQPRRRGSRRGGCSSATTAARARVLALPLAAASQTRHVPDQAATVATSSRPTRPDRCCSSSEADPSLGFSTRRRNRTSEPRTPVSPEVLPRRWHRRARLFVRASLSGIARMRTCDERRNRPHLGERARTDGHGRVGLRRDTARVAPGLRSCPSGQPLPAESCT